MTRADILMPWGGWPTGQSNLDLVCAETDVHVWVGHWGGEPPENTHNTTVFPAYGLDLPRVVQRFLGITRRSGTDVVGRVDDDIRIVPGTLETLIDQLRRDEPALSAPVIPQMRPPGRVWGCCHVAWRSAAGHELYSRAYPAWATHRRVRYADVPAVTHEGSGGTRRPS